MMICFNSWYVWGWGGDEEMLSQRKCVFLTSAMPLQICLFCTIWHQTQQAVERWLLLVVPH